MNDPTKEKLIDKDFTIQGLHYNEDEGLLTCDCVIFGQNLDFTVWFGHAEADCLMPKGEWKSYACMLDDFHNMHYLLLQHDGTVISRAVNLEPHLEEIAEERYMNKHSRL